MELLKLMNQPTPQREVQTRYQNPRAKRRAEARKVARVERKARVAAARERGLVRFKF